MPTRRNYRRKNKRKTTKRKRKHSCKCRSKYCGIKRGGKKIKRCKTCIKKRCKCLNKRKYKRSIRRSKRYKQKGCAKQKGGGNNFTCNNALNMGEIYSGSNRNSYNLILNPRSTQNNIPGIVNNPHTQKGGGLSQQAINFGLGQGVSLFRSAQNSMADLGRTWYGDHKVESSDVTVESNRM